MQTHPILDAAPTRGCKSPTRTAEPTGRTLTTDSNQRSAVRGRNSGRAGQFIREETNSCAQFSTIRALCFLGRAKRLFDRIAATSPQM